MKDSNGCDLSCPIDCGADGVYCYDSDGNGCVIGSCKYPTTSDCPAACTSWQCPNGLMPCSKGVDENNCDLGYYCLPYTCRGCPAMIDPLSGTSSCPDISWADLIVCPGSGREECPQTDICIYNPVWNDTTVGGCNVDVCPAFCDYENGQMACSDYPSNSNGNCPKFSEYCLPQIDDVGCYNSCPIDCPGKSFTNSIFQLTRINYHCRWLDQMP